MNQRERVLIVLAVAALLIGGGYFLWDRYFGSVAGPEQDPQEVVQARATKDLVDAELTKLGLAPAQTGLLGFIASPWIRDPFLVPLARQDMQQEIPEDRDWFVYSGYIEVGPVQMAIINGKEHFLGDELDVPGYSILSIDPAQVVIARPDGESTLKIVYQGLGEL